MSVGGAWIEKRLPSVSPRLRSTVDGFSAETTERLSWDRGDTYEPEPIDDA